MAVKPAIVEPAVRLPDNARQATAPLWETECADGKHRPAWNPGRSRGLARVASRIGDLRAEVERLVLSHQSNVRILEVGCGYGRALLELKQLFGKHVNLIGINKEADWDHDLVKKFAEMHGLADEADDVPIMNADACRPLPFPAGYFDLIYSVSAIQYFSDKAAFLLEVNRLLSADGIAVLDVDNTDLPYVSEMNHRFEVWHEGSRTDALEYLRGFPNFEVRRGRDRPNGYVKMTKLDGLDLGIELVASYDVNRLCDGWWGTKTVYRTKGP